MIIQHLRALYLHCGLFNDQLKFKHEKPKHFSSKPVENFGSGASSFTTLQVLTKRLCDLILAIYKLRTLFFVCIGKKTSEQKLFWQ